MKTRKKIYMLLGYKTKKKKDLLHLNESGFILWNGVDEL